MNATGGKTPSSARQLSEYTTNALEQIRKDLQTYSQKNGEGQVSGAVSPQLQQQQQQPQHIQQQPQNVMQGHFSMPFVNTGGYITPEDAYRMHRSPSNGRMDQHAVIDTHQMNGHSSKIAPALAPKLIRKQSIERELSHSYQILRGSPAIDSGAGSSRSDSPHSYQQLASGRISANQYSPSPCPSNYSDAPPPPLPRSSSTPPTPPPVPQNFPQFHKRIPPTTGPMRPVTLASQSPARGTSPVSNSTHSRQPVIAQNGPQAQQQLSQQMQALSIYQSGGNTPGEPPPPYPIMASTAPPSYTVSIQNRQSPTQSQSDYRKSPSSGIYSANSAGSPSPITVTQHTPIARPVPAASRSTWQTTAITPIIMQSVKSTQVQKPILQTAIAPPTPPATSTTAPVVPPMYASTPAPPPYNSSIQQKSQQNHYNNSVPLGKPPASVPNQQSNDKTPPTTPPVIPMALPKVNGALNIPTTEPPSYASSMQAKMAAKQSRAMPPPPPYNVNNASTKPGYSSPSSSPEIVTSQTKNPPAPPYSNHVNGTNNNIAPNALMPPTSSSSVKNGKTNGKTTKDMNGNTECSKIKHQSPIPERKIISKEKEDERKECRIKHYSPQAYKFFMEQHIENVLKSCEARNKRKGQLEQEMSKLQLSSEMQENIRLMLNQKESNYMRLRRAKMDITMFEKIENIGVGAFGEVSLVKKRDCNMLYALKKLRKSDVVKRNQVAHVKAERDILAEADNEWVVKLYYSFQDKDYLYFVMDYIPGGDLMALLIKKGIFEEPFARFYIAELTCAIESVHNMGFIHRDIKPDNILIDRQGHIKLTDFGLCTGFRWTHNSKYYQNEGDHTRQNSMEPWEVSKPVLERRRDRQRSLAHSLVGTPNYIAPEVLERVGYSQLCDWWSVGVILYEMLVGKPPFLANTPQETQQKVINWESTLHIPPEANLCADAINLITRLCTHKENRLGKTATEVKAHRFFKDIDFNKNLRAQPAPYTPIIQYATDTSNFDPIDPDKLHDMSGDSHTSREDVGNYFYEFTFRRFFDVSDGNFCYLHSK